MLKIMIEDFTGIFGILMERAFKVLFLLDLLKK